MSSPVVCQSWTAPPWTTTSERPDVSSGEDRKGHCVSSVNRKGPVRHEHVPRVRKSGKSIFRPKEVLGGPRRKVPLQSHHPGPST